MVAPMPSTSSLAVLSTRLTKAIAQVELQRATLEETLLRLATEADTLDAVSAAMLEAAATQGSVLQALQQLAREAPARAPNPTAAASAPADGRAAWAEARMGRAAVGAPAPAPSASLAPASATVCNGYAPAPCRPAAVFVPPAAGGASSVSSPQTPTSQQTHTSQQTSNSQQAPGPAGRLPSAPSARAASTIIAPAPAAPPPQPQPPLRPRPLLPSASAPVLMRPPERPKIVEPDMDDCRIEYVSNLRLDGQAAVGGTLTASAEFVGKGDVFWSRVQAAPDGGTGGGAEGVRIDGADSFSYVLTADDVGCHVRVTCTSAVGGDLASLTTPAPVTLPADLASQLGHARKKAEKGEYSCVVHGAKGEARVLLLTRDKLKLRKKGMAGMTLSKVEMAAGVPVTLDPFDETTLEIQARSSLDTPPRYRASPTFGISLREACPSPYLEIQARWRLPPPPTGISPRALFPIR